MRRLSKKIGFVGRHTIDQMDKLLIHLSAIKHIHNIRVKIGIVERANPLVKTSFEHHTLSCG